MSVVVYPPQPRSGAETVHSDNSRRFKQLLFLNEYPPSSLAGAPVIARQLFRYYDPDAMDMVVCESWYGKMDEKARETLLPCRHTVIPSFRKYNLRPHRIFGKVEATLDVMRMKRIMAVGRRIIEEKKVRALFTMSYGCEMPMAAYFLHKEYGLPLYYFETDDLTATPNCAMAARIINKYRQDFMDSVKKLWLTSPAMVREFHDRYGIEGEFLFHFVDVNHYQAAVDDAKKLSQDRIHLVYTGSINHMFWDTMLWFCERLNRGLTIDGRPVEMTIYCASAPNPALLGPYVRWGGFVPLDQIPEKLAQAHIAAILVSFTQEPSIKKLIQTSLYTKTVDYLAASRPVLVVSPTYSSEVDYFAPVTAVVDKADEEPIVAAIRRILNDKDYSDRLRRDGLELVRQRHSLEALERIFLSHFREDA